MNHPVENPTNAVVNNSYQATAESFKKSFLRKAHCLTLGESHTVKVNAVNLYQDPIRGLVHICNLDALSSEHMSQIKTLVADEDYLAAQNLSLTMSARDGKDFTPAKGQLINIVLGEVPNAQGEAVIRVISASPLPAAKSTKVSLEDLLG